MFYRCVIVFGISFSKSKTETHRRSASFLKKCKIKKCFFGVKTYYMIFHKETRHIFKVHYAYIGSSEKQQKFNKISEKAFRDSCFFLMN